MNDLYGLGRALSNALGSGPSRATIAGQRARVLAALSRGKPFELSSWRFGLTLACGAMALAAALFWLREPAAELHARYQGRDIAERTRVVASNPAGEALDFSDGSRLFLDSQAEISVSRLSREQARIDVARGGLTARIKKGTGRSWAIAAGPYSVQVVGTEFSVDWDQEQAELAVNVTEGKVKVTGGGLPAAGVVLVAGGRLVRRAQAETAALSSGSGPASADAPASAPSSELPASSPKELVRRGSAPAEPSWRTAADGAKYAVAMQHAEREGFDNLVNALPEKELLLLANTARYAGSIPRARQALLGLRSRFASKASAPVAALLLAGLAEDHAKNPDEAATWLRVFLRESPRGELSAGARARLLAILVRQGKNVEARTVASDYLRHHPRGPYAEQARSVVGTSAPQ